MKKNILQMSMTERFKYLNEQKRKKFNAQLNKTIQIKRFANCAVNKFAQLK